VRAQVESIRLQREPFDAHGAHAEGFDIPLGSDKRPRFSKHQLWHVEVAFAAPVEGPLLLGDGRFCGLGLLAPAADVVPGVHVFAITAGLIEQPDPTDVSRALRRAVMARVQAVLGARARLAPFFSGHSEDGAPIRRARSSHLAFAFAPESRRLVIIAPHVAERRMATTQELEHLRTLDAALEGFSDLRAGPAGLLALAPNSNERLVVGRSRVWETITPYVVTRHAKNGVAMDALTTDVLSECRRLGLSKPKVETSNIRGQDGVGLTGDVKLFFEQSVAGPLLLGRTRYLGGGLFQPVEGTVKS
jgi:CRISPR-associated protein Csb2